jgi:hypothetical protein
VLFSRRDRRRVSPPLPARSALFAGAAVLLLAGATIGGCASNCATNCPNIEFDVVATVGENLNVYSATWSGAGCPTNATPSCRGNFDGTNICVRFTMIAPHEGTCQLDLAFTDGRPQFSATATFGPATTQGCCQGFPVVGPALATVPPLHPVIGFDAGSDGEAGSGDGGGDDAGTDAGSD